MFRKFWNILWFLETFWDIYRFLEGFLGEKLGEFLDRFLEHFFFGYLCLGLRGVYTERCPNGYLCPKKCCPWTSRPTGWGCCNFSNGVCCDGDMDGKYCPKSLRCRTFFFPAFLKLFWISLKFVFIISIS